jgi:predicted PolB exonuclease-like 3'-5' exonuclease
LTPVLAFDIETVPDVEGIRKIHGLPADLPASEVAEVAFQRRRAQSGATSGAASDFLPPHLHRVVAIACVLREAEGVQVFSLGEPERDEAATIQKFFDGIDKYTPQLVSWNGGGFDLPVLGYRALVCGGCATRYWDQGEDDREFKFNNYIGRYHSRHLDLMDLLALYQPRNNAPLDDMALLAGLPGKIGVGGAQVWKAYLAGEKKKIRDYCEVDTANTYLLYLRFQRLRGAFTPDQYKRECGLFREMLQAKKDPHWQEFLRLWKA